MAGQGLFLVGCGGGALLLYLIVLFPPTVASLRDDQYYVALVPLTLIPCLLANYLSWFFRKLFRLN